MTISIGLTYEFFNIWVEMLDESNAEHDKHVNLLNKVILLYNDFSQGL